MEHGKDIASAQLGPDFRTYPVDDHGKVRVLYGKVTAAAALAQDGTFALFKLPFGRKRILPARSTVTTSAFGTGRTLEIGHTAYLNATPNTVVDEDPDAFTAALDVSSAVTNAPLSTAMKFDIYSADALFVFGTVRGGTMPVDATVEVLLEYVCE